MRHTLKAVAVLLACSLSMTSALAQSGKGSSRKHTTKEETVIIRKDSKDGKTVIEIRDGKVFVNGEAVVTVSDGELANVRKKVIIEDGGAGDAFEERVFRFPGEDDNAPGVPRRAMLGVLTDPKTEKVGALIKDVTPGSAAEKAGLQSGDLITRIDGKAIKDAQALVAEIGAQHEAGDKVDIEYEREGKSRNTTAKLQAAGPRTAMRGFRFAPENMPGEMPNTFFRNFPFSAGDDMAPAPKLGLSAEDRADGEGVRVLSVKPGSAAASAGLREGDVITRLDNEKVGSVDELQMSLRGMKGGDKIKLEYQRSGNLATAEVRLPKPVKRKDL